MKLLRNFLFLGFVFIGYSFNAQQVSVRDTLGGTILNTSMDSQVAKAMMDMESKCNNKKSNSYDGSYTTNNDNTSVKRILVPSRALTNEEICRKNPKISGFKIQVDVVKSNDEANQIRADFRSKFPNLKVEIDASLRPNYKILAGSYFTKASASQDLKNIRKQFGSAVSVQYRIFCAEAK
jgi:hypothetical protein